MAVAVGLAVGGDGHGYHGHHGHYGHYGHHTATMATEALHVTIEYIMSRVQCTQFCQTT